MRDARLEVVFHSGGAGSGAALLPRAGCDLRHQHHGHGTRAEAMRSVPSVSAAVIVTTDKCYDFGVATRPCREGDTLGGDDPYSASKAAAEVAVASYRRSYFEGRGGGRPIPIATGRAGNVIGGGDWSPDRIVTDLVAALDAGGALELRYPKATRPWQHVLDALAGYAHAGAEAARGRSPVRRRLEFRSGRVRDHDRAALRRAVRAERGSGRAAGARPLASMRPRTRTSRSMPARRAHSLGLAAGVEHGASHPRFGPLASRCRPRRLGTRRHRGLHCGLSGGTRPGWRCKARGSERRKLNEA